MGTQAGRAINDDARAFRQRADRRYDMIMMYTVDSHTKLAATAGLRLDSYLYTVESFEQIRDHLAPGGVFVMNFNLSQESLPWARARLNAMLDKVFGPGSWRKEEAVGGYVHLVKPTSMDQAIRDALVPRDIALATDDWPQFYLRDRMIPGPYVRVFLWLLALSAVLVAILLANGFVARFRPEGLRPCYALLVLAILASYFLPVSRLLAFPYPVRAAIASLSVAVPIFLAGIIFATSFRKDANPEAAFGSNLLGAVLGGLGEYLSLLLGVRALAFVILAFYLLSARFAIRPRPSVPASPLA